MSTRPTRAEIEAMEVEIERLQNVCRDLRRKYEFEWRNGERWQKQYYALLDQASETRGRQEAEIDAFTLALTTHFPRYKAHAREHYERLMKQTVPAEKYYGPPKESAEGGTD